MYKTYVITANSAEKLNDYIKKFEEKGWYCVDVQISSAGVGNTFITQYIAAMRKD